MSCLALPGAWPHRGNSSLSAPRESHRFYAARSRLLLLATLHRKHHFTALALYNKTEFSFHDLTLPSNSSDWKFARRAMAISSCECQLLAWGPFRLRACQGLEEPRVWDSLGLQTVACCEESTMRFWKSGRPLVGSPFRNFRHTVLLPAIQDFRRRPLQL